MKTFEGAFQYAQALFNLAQAHKQTDQTLLELETVQKALTHHQRMLKLLAVPSVDTAKKYEALETVFGKKLSPLTLNFLKLIVRKNHIEGLNEILLQFKNLILKNKNTSSAKVISAWPLAADLLKKLEKKLEALTQRKIKLEHTLDRSLIGGAVIHIENRLIDFSLKRQLQDLKEALTC